MSRLKGQADMEYVPSDEATLVSTVDLIDWRELPNRVVLFDPCAGEGKALRTLELAMKAKWQDASGATPSEDDFTTYGIELDRNRARAARKVVDNMLQADYFNALISDHGFNIIHSNPPYDYNPEVKREGHKFLMASTRLMGFGTLLFHWIPRHELAVSAEFLSRNFSNFRVWQDEGNPEAGRFNQIIVAATRHTYPDNPEKMKQQLLDFSEGKIDFIGEKYPNYKLRHVGKVVERFTALRIDYEDVLDEVVRTGFETKQEWTDWSDPPGNELVRPRMPLRMGHMGLIMAGGGVGGLGIPVTAGDEAMIFRATSTKIKIATPQNDAGTVQVIAEKMDNSAVLLDPSDWSFTDKVNLAEFVLKWRDPLAAYLSDVMPPTYSPARLREMLGGKPRFKKLLRPPMPGKGQRSAIEGVMFGLLGGERSNTVVGEMGTGKTFISLAAVYLAGKWRVIILCPPTMPWKWEDEIMKTVPKAHVYVVGKTPSGKKAKTPFYRMHSSPMKQLAWLNREYGEDKEDVPLFIVMAHSTAKMSYGRIPAVNWRWGYRPQPEYGEVSGELVHPTWVPFKELVAKASDDAEEEVKTSVVNRYMQMMCCPECRMPIVDRKGDYASWDWLAKGRRRCLNELTVGRIKLEDQTGGAAYGTETRLCDAPLWQALAKNYIGATGVDTGYPQHEEQLKAKVLRHYLYGVGVDADRALELGGKGSLSPDYEPEMSAIWDSKEREVLKSDKYPARKYDLAEYIKTQMPNLADVLITDEVHQFKAGDSAQGMMARMLAEVVPQRISLTGTLMAGYARDLFHLLYGFGGPEVRKDFEHNDATRWRNIHGFVEKTVYLEAENAKRSKVRKKNEKPKDLPGAMPSVLKYILGQSVFIRLKDVAAGLPPFTEHVVSVPLNEDVDPETGCSQGENYRDLEQSMLQEIKSLTYSNPRAAQQLVSIFAQAVLTYPDACTQDGACTVYSPADGMLIIDRLPLTADKVYPKEEKLVEICLSEKEAGRKTLVFATHTNKRDLLPRMQDMLERNGLKVKVLRSGTPWTRTSGWSGFRRSWRAGLMS